MENSPKPTRAEVSDVANAVIDGVDAMTLSDETAVGKYPIETLETMKKIIINMEDNLDYDKFMDNKKNDHIGDVTTIIAENVAASANKIKASAIIASSLSGYTAKMISSFHPSCPIIVTTPNEQTARSLSLNYGTMSVVTPLFNATDDIVENGLREAKKILPLEDATVIVTGSFPSDANITNFMKIETIK
jgi:pyruvate kinase